MENISHRRTKKEAGIENLEGGSFWDEVELGLEGEPCIREDVGECLIERVKALLRF